MAEKNKNIKKHLWILVAILCTMFWGSAAPAIKLGYLYFELKADDVYSILIFAGLRFFGGGFMTLVLSRFITGKAPRFYKELIGPTVVMATVQTVLQYFFFYMGLTIVAGANGVLLSSTGTFFAVIIAVLIGLEKMTGRKLIGILLGLSGIVVLNLGSDLSFNLRLNGEVFILLSALCYALHNILVKYFSKKHEPITLTGYQFILGGAVLSLIGYLGGGRLIWPGFAKSQILFLLMFVAAMGYGLWSMLLKKHDTSKVVIFNALTPVFGALFSWLILSEDIWRWNTLASLLLIALGISMINWTKKRADLN